MADGHGAHGIAGWGWDTTPQWGRWYPRGVPYNGSPQFLYLMTPSSSPGSYFNVHIILCKRVIYAVVSRWDDRRFTHDRQETIFPRSAEGETHAKTWCEVIARMSR